MIQGGVALGVSVVGIAVLSVPAEGAAPCADVGERIATVMSDSTKN